MTRKPFIAGNWKMNTTLKEAVTLAQDIVTAVGANTEVDIAICPPYVNLSAVYEVIKNSTIKLGAQDLHWEQKGAYTGKVSADMLKAVGVSYVIIGHSEQRTYFHETDETVNKKLNAALAADLFPIVCVGETLTERKEGRMKHVVETQMRGAFAQIASHQAQRCTIAYEPVWAIGTGETATPQQANEAHTFIRTILSELYDDELSQRIRIQYGGSMKPENAKELLGQPDVDGGLIGGAALKADSFANIVIPT